jgi:hypothetical protein
VLWFGPLNAWQATRDVTLTPGARLELGDVVLAAPARLALDAGLPDDLAAGDVFVLVLTPDGRSVRAQGSLAELAGGVELSAGAYTVRLGGYAVPEEHGVEIHAGQTTRLAVAPRRAAGLALEFELADGVEAPRTLAVELTGDSGVETQTLYPSKAEPDDGLLHATRHVAPDEPLFARFSGPGLRGEAWIGAEMLAQGTRGDVPIRVMLGR